MDGWIKIHRRLLEWEWYDDTNVVRLFLHLLLTANYDDKNWHGITIKRGQLLTSIQTLAEQTRLSFQQTRTALSKLKSTNEITCESTNSYTLITVCKYATYQAQENAEQQTNNTQDNKQITNEQQATQQTDNNNIRNKEERNKEYNNIPFIPLQGEQPAPQKKKSAVDYIQAVEELEPEVKEAVMQCAQDVETWIDYKKSEFHKAYKSATTFKTFLRHLHKLGNGNPETMKAIIEQSIANRYEGIFELKKSYSYGISRNNPDSPDYIPTERIVAAGFAMAKAGM